MEELDIRLMVDLVHAYASNQYGLQGMPQKVQQDLQTVIDFVTDSLEDYRKNRDLYRSDYDAALAAAHVLNDFLLGRPVSSSSDSSPESSSDEG